MKCSEYLDLAIKKTGCKNDNQLKDVLGWRSSKVFNYRHNKQFMDNDAAREMSELLDIPLVKIVADMESQRFERQGKKDKALAWNKLSKMAGFASPILLILLGFIAFVVREYCILC